MAKINEDVIDVLKRCSTEGNVVKLPAEQLDRKIYMDVAKQLQLIGGKWKSGKTQGFVFEQEPAELLAKLCEGDGVNLKKEFQFFATPSHLAKRLVDLAEVNDYQRIIEPSAGDGAIIWEIQKQCRVVVDYCELMDLNVFKIERNTNNQVRFLGHDFLAADILSKPQYDRVIANPPFNKNQDIDHILQMYRMCKKGGRIVTIASKHWLLSDNKKEKNFREWVANMGIKIIEVPAGEFKDSGTNIATCILVINK